MEVMGMVVVVMTGDRGGGGEGGVGVEGGGRRGK